MRKLRPKVTQAVSGRARVSGSSLALEPVCFITALCHQETSACLILSMKHVIQCLANRTTHKMGSSLFLIVSLA